MKRTLALAAILSTLACAVVVRAQQQPSTPQMPSRVFSSQPSSLDDQGVRNYLLGPGDVLEVRVLFQPDLNSVVEVDSEGNLSSLPFVEAPIRAMCRSEKEVQKDIAKSYSKYLKNPQVSVFITDKRSRVPALVTGAVRRPTRVTMLRKVRLNELIAQAEGFTERASGTIQILHMEPLMCPEPGEEAAEAALDKTKLEIVRIADLRAGKPEGNPFIRPGDSVLVTEADPVFVTGSVLNPQMINMTDNLTLGRALATVGGPTREAKTSDVQIRRHKPGAQAAEVIHVDYAAIRKNQKPDVPLQAFDQIDVPQAGMLSGSRIGATMMGIFTGTVPSLITNSTIR